VSSAPPGFAPSDLGAAFHADADATRGAHARELLGARWVAYALTLGIGATILLGAAQHSMGTMVIGPMVVLALVALAVFRAASKRSEEDFYAAMARGLGLSLSPHAALLPLTPLLGAGDRRNFAHLMEGPVARLNPASPACVLGHYAYEVRHERGDEPDVYESHAFTICVVELEQGLQRFRGIFLRRRRGLVGGLGHDWLAGIDRREREAGAPRRPREDRRVPEHVGDQRDLATEASQRGGRHLGADARGVPHADGDAHRHGTHLSGESSEMRVSMSASLRSSAMYWAR